MKLSSLKSDVVDLSNLKEIFGDDYEACSQMTTFFFIQVDEKLPILLEAIENSNFDEIKNTSHLLKSSFGVMGLTSKDILIDIEYLGLKKENIFKIEELTNLVIKNYEESKKELKKLFDI